MHVLGPLHHVVAVAELTFGLSALAESRHLAAEGGSQLPHKRPNHADHPPNQTADCEADPK